MTLKDSLLTHSGEWLVPVKVLREIAKSWPPQEARLLKATLDSLEKVLDADEQEAA